MSAAVRPPTDDAAERAARQRLDAFMATLVRIGIDDFRTTALSAGDDPAVERARTAGAARARDLGLDDLVSEARQAAQDLIVQAYAAAQYNPSIVGLNWGLSAGPTSDRVAVGIAVADAAMAAVLEPFLAQDDVATLRARYDLIDPGREDPKDHPAPAGRTAPADRIPEALLIGAVAVILAVAYASGGWVLVAAAALPVVLYRRRKAAAGRRAEDSSRS